MSIRREIERAFESPDNVDPRRQRVLTRLREAVDNAIEKGGFRDIPDEDPPQHESFSFAYPVVIYEATRDIRSEEPESIRSRIYRENIPDRDYLEINGEAVQLARRINRMTEADVVKGLTGLNKNKLVAIERESRFDQIVGNDERGRLIQNNDKSFIQLLSRTAGDLAAKLNTNLESITLPPYGEVIREWRNNRNYLTQLHLARVTAIPSTAISNFENHVTRYINQDRLEALARGLSIHPAILLYRRFPDEVNEYR